MLGVLALGTEPRIQEQLRGKNSQVATFSLTWKEKLIPDTEALPFLTCARPKVLLLPLEEWGSDAPFVTGAWQAL